METATHVAKRRLQGRKGGNETRHVGHRRTTHVRHTRNTHTGDNNAAEQQEMGRMTRTKEGDNKGRETSAKRRESDVRASGQMRKIIGGISKLLKSL